MDFHSQAPGSKCINNQIKKQCKNLKVSGNISLEVVLKMSGSFCMFLYKAGQTKFTVYRRNILHAGGRLLFRFQI